MVNITTNLVEKTGCFIKDRSKITSVLLVIT